MWAARDAKLSTASRIWHSRGLALAITTREKDAKILQPTSESDAEPTEASSRSSGTNLAHAVKMYGVTEHIPTIIRKCRQVHGIGFFELE